MASLLYKVGLSAQVEAWDTGVTPPELVALVESEGSLSPSGTLDLGCGTGTKVVYLCRQGWETTGVDLVARALAIARRKAAPAGVEPRLLQGDVTRLGDLDIGEGYSLLLDPGCYHSLFPVALRDAYAKGVTAAAGRGPASCSMASCPASERSTG